MTNPQFLEPNLLERNVLQEGSLSIEDFVVLVQETVHNENIPDGTSLCFQMFFSVMGNSIHNKTLNEDYTQLNIISDCVKHLQRVQKFNTFVFVDHLLNEFLIIPLEIVWWLHKNEIMYFYEYCNKLKPVDLAIDLLKLQKSDVQHKLFITSEIMKDILTELIRGCCRPQIGISRLDSSITWSTYCLQVLNDLIEDTVRTVLTGANKPLTHFLPFVGNSKNYIPSVVIKKFYIIILNKLMSHKVDEFNLYNSYLYQSLWCSEKIDKNLLLVYEELFAKHCAMKDILEIMEEQEKVNWKFTLAAVGVCVKKSQTGSADVKDAAMKNLNDSFKGGKIKQFIKALLLVRQGCMEENMNTDYCLWYSSTFGTKSNFKTTNNAALCNFFIKSLTKLIPYEPKHYLEIHLQQVISIPPNCIAVMHDYKNLCRARLEELRRSPSILVNGVKMMVVHIIEASAQNEVISPIMLDIVHKQPEDYYNIIIPQVLQNKMPFIKVKEILLKKEYLTKEIIHFTRVDDEGKVFDDDLVLKKKISKLVKEEK